MTQFQDVTAKGVVETECLKRNKHISRFHVMRWKALWCADKGGWFPALRPMGAAK